MYPILRILSILSAVRRIVCYFTVIAHGGGCLARVLAGNVDHRPLVLAEA